MAFDAEPQWTERAEKRGLDPLGLQGSGVGLYQQLVPGISNVTLRIRYYGLYAWLTAAYARISGSTDPLEWRRWVRRAEALYALAAADAGAELGVGGVLWAQGFLADIAADDLIDFRLATETKGPAPYLQQPWGVYGGAYSSQLVELGILAPALEHETLVPTAELGLPLADAFRESLGPDTEALLLGSIESGTVRKLDLARLHIMLLSRVPRGSIEAELYLTSLFGMGPQASAGALARRQTLQLILAVAQEAGGMPTPDGVRWALFAASPGHFGEALEPTRLRWEAYQSHDLLQLALATFLRQALELLRVERAGLTYPELTAQASAVLCATTVGGGDLPWKAIVSASAAASPPDLERKLSRIPEHGLPSDCLASALTLLAFLQARVDARPDLAGEIETTFSAASFPRSIKSELAFLRAHDDAPLSKLAPALFAERVVRRHSQVAMLKFSRQRDYTFLFEGTDGRLSYRASYSPVLTTPRLGPAITFLGDLGLLGAAGITAAGENWLGQPA